MKACQGIRKLSENEFSEMVINSDGPAVVDFWATWCAPCRQLEEILGEVATEYGGKISFFKIDVNESSQIASKYSVRSIPMLLFFNRGEIVGHAIGALSKETLEEKIRMLAESA